MVKVLISLVVICAPFLPACTIFRKNKTVPEHAMETYLVNNSVTYIGHATVFIHLDSTNIITDPMFSDYISWFAKRYVEPGIKLENLPPVDVILISHEHYDHLDEPTLSQLSKDIPVVISKELVDDIEELGFNDVRGLKWWESTTINGIKITATPAQHIASNCSGYIVEGSKTIYFAGDTGLVGGMKEIGKKFAIDVALLPIGDYSPRLWFIPGFNKMTRERHMAPGDIPAAIEMLQNQMVIPIHWGTFKISGTDLNEPIEWLYKIIKEKKLEEKVIILKHGEGLNLK